MQRRNGWLEYLHVVSAQGRDLAQYANVVAHQWAHDVRCVRQGIDHRRVGGTQDHGHDEWLQAGFAARLSTLGK